MAKVFYMGGGTHTRGMLRAVLTMNQLESLVASELMTHVGHEFPQGSDAAITVIEISHDEATAKRAAGYFQVAATPSDFDERLSFLPVPSNLPERKNKQALRNGSDLIRWLTRDMRSGA